MSYPGNPSLAQEVQQRTMATFKQSLDLAAQGKEQEALAGCEFILGLDPLFQPARKLQDRLKGQERPLRLDDLRQVGEEPLELDPLEIGDLAPLDLDDGPPAPVAPPQPAAPQPAAPASGLGAVLQDLLQKRNYQQVLTIAETQREAIAKDSQLQEMVRTALSALAQVPSETPPAPVPPAEEGLLSFEESEAPLSFDLDKPAAAPQSEEDDLLALQQQSLALEEQVEGSLPGMGELEDLEPLDLDADELPDLDDDLEDDLDDDLGLSDDFGTSDVREVEAGAPFAHGQERELELPDTGDDDLDEGSRERITQLLGEGQEAFGRGDYQGAIDVWSRIFLIDISNSQASQRIEEARSKKAELERQGEEAFHEATGFIEQGAIEQAKEALGRVLDFDPNHSLAREYLEQLEAGQVPVLAAQGGDFDDGFGGPLAETSGEEAAAAMAAAVQRDRIVVVKKTDKKLIAAAAAVGILVIGGGAYLFMNKDKLFPNTENVAPVAPPRIDPIARATRLHEGGKTEEAIAQLREIPTDDPAYSEALALIDQWEALISSQQERDQGPPPELLARRGQFIAAARQAHGLRQFLRARKYFDRAHKILPLAAEDTALKLNCDSELESLVAEIQGFQDGEYAAIIPSLWRKRDQEPDNNDIRLLLVDSYFNLALTDLQRKNPKGAAEKLKDALDVAPEDDDLRRLYLFAQTYSERSQDLLYLIFVKYLPSRG